jgi:murein DD-endopeptidase MepM/ murein hydrolase activator NlpD
VLRAADAYPDQIPFQPWPGPAAGNHVRIGTGTEEVLLAHLRPGSVQVARGDLVRRGQVIGQVGNSGNSTEPHLHIHAERNGTGLRLRFEGIKRLSRGTRIKVTATPAASPGADGRSTTDPLPGP